MKKITRANQVGYAGLVTLPVHGKGAYDPLKHTVLTCSRISEFDRTQMEAVLKPIITGPQVMNLPNGVNGWNCCVQDMMGRVLLISYRGIECTLFFKRQLTEIKLQPGDRFPEGVLKDPDDAWQRLDLLGKSAKQSNVILTNLHVRLEEENKLLQDRVDTLNKLYGVIETKLLNAEELMSHFTFNEKKL